MRTMIMVMAISFTQMACAESNAGSPNGEVQTSVDAGNCLPGKSGVTRLVTHYYVPLLEKFDDFTCNKMEGTCIYKVKGVPWLHNYGYEDQPLSEARCKNGYGNKQNCLNPCRTIAASTRHHRFGEVMYIPALVGQKCGNPRDGTDMIHDGYVVVGDTGAKSHFNATGRFDFFWGRCANKRDGVCHEGALNLSQSASKSAYCMVWNPADPLKNVDIKLSFTAKVREEAIRRGDLGAADDFDLDKAIGKGTE